MTANPELVKERNISPENVEYINQFHDLLAKLINSYTLEIPYQEAKELVQSANKSLSDLWGFVYNPAYDTWTPRLTEKWMKLTFAGRKFRCKDTGDVVEIDIDDCYETSYIPVGSSGLDLGRADSYYRIIGNIEEIK